VNGSALPCLVMAVLAWLVDDGSLDSRICGLVVCLSSVCGYTVTYILTFVTVARSVLDY